MGSEGTSRHKLARAKVRPLRAVLCSAPEMASAIPYISLALACFTVGCQTCYLVPGSQNVSKLRQEIKEMRAELAELRSCAPALNVSGHSDNMPQISNASNAGLAMQRASGAADRLWTVCAGAPAQQPVTGYERCGSTTQAHGYDAKGAYCQAMGGLHMPPIHW
ncbi:hypothetical protein HaLaN_02781 [Haematococcus lacustris]|uniref:Uncharacterized protein n=1 Tax=Haematococcus lacustris TaxID=44745 RepID=A0A699YEY8_HAELA|nr:hypothetical protein HaLaN_02781 [Haematococcus lacustris]